MSLWNRIWLVKHICSVHVVYGFYTFFTVFSINVRFSRLAQIFIAMFVAGSIAWKLQFFFPWMKHILLCTLQSSNLFLATKLGFQNLFSKKRVNNIHKFRASYITFSKINKILLYISISHIKYMLWTLNWSLLFKIDEIHIMHTVSKIIYSKFTSTQLNTLKDCSFFDFT